MSYEVLLSLGLHMKKLMLRNGQQTNPGHAVSKEDIWDCDHICLVFVYFILLYHVWYVTGSLQTLAKQRSK